MNFALSEPRHNRSKTSNLTSKSTELKKIKYEQERQQSQNKLTASTNFAGKGIFNGDPAK